MRAAIYYHPEAFSLSSPRLMGRNVAGESFLRGFIKYKTDEASTKISSITIFGTQITLSDSNLKNITHTLSNTSQDGVIPFTITIEDQAGNQKKDNQTTDNSTVYYDTTPPQITEITPTLKFLKVSDNATIEFTTNELIKVPQVMIAGQNASVTGEGQELSLIHI